MTQPGCKRALYKLISRIKQSANKAGIHTVRDMALVSGVSKSGVDKIYNHRSYPTFDTLLAMAQACGTTVHLWTYELEQDKDAKGKRPEPKPKDDQPKPVEPDKPKAAKPEPNPVEPKSEPEPNPIEDKGKINLMAMLHGMKPE